MKTNSIIRALGASLLIALSGCQAPSGTTSVSQVERVERIAQSAAKGGATVFLIKNPRGRADLERVKSILTDLVDRKVWDLQLVADALLQANLKELRSVEAVLIIETSVGLIDAISGERIALPTPELAQAVIRGALYGVTFALNTVPVPQAYYLPGEGICPTLFAGK